MRRQVDLFLEFMETQKNSSDNTIAAYRNDLEQFMNFVERKYRNKGKTNSTWSTLTVKEVDIYLAYLTDDKAYAPATIARKLAAIKSFLHYLYNAGKIKADPAKDVEPPKVEKSLPRTITHDEILKLLAEPAKSTTPKGLRDKSIMELLYATGMRVTELISLNSDDVDLSKGTVICGGNGKRQRTVTIPSSVVDHLQQYLEQGRSILSMTNSEETNSEETALFLNHRGQRLTRQGLWLIIKGYVDSVGIHGNVTPHTLRHSFAAHLLNSGAELKDLQERLGHASISTTQVYRQDTSSEKSTLIVDGKEVTPNKNKETK